MKKGIKAVIRHLVLLVLSVFWLIPIVWLVCTSFSGYAGINIRNFFPETWTLKNYSQLLIGADNVAQFPKWFMNTLVIAIFTCLISTCLVLMVAYATSCMRFNARKPLMNLGIILNMFPACFP